MNELTLKLIFLTLLKASPNQWVEIYDVRGKQGPKPVQELHCNVQRLVYHRLNRDFLPSNLF